MNNNIINEDNLYWLILFCVFLQCVAFVPSIVNSYYNQNVDAYNYLTLFFLLIVFSIFFVICIYRGYYPQMILFAIATISLLILIAMKITYEDGFNFGFQSNNKGYSWKELRHYDEDVSSLQKPKEDHKEDHKEEVNKEEEKPKTQQQQQPQQQPQQQQQTQQQQKQKKQQQQQQQQQKKQKKKKKKKK